MSDEGESARESLRREVSVAVAGFDDRDTIVDRIREWVDDTPDLEGESVDVEGIVDAALEALRREEATWPPRTDNDRLDLAFAALRKDGILALQNYWCCQTCASGAAFEEMTDGGFRGYVYFHEQDTDGAIDGEGLYLAFGADEDTEDAAIGVAGVAAARLRLHDLEVEWDGSYAKRLFVRMKWQRRRFTSAA